MKKNQTTVPENLKRLRKQRKMTQEDVAKILGYKGKDGYGKLELGIRSIKDWQIKRLAQFYGIKENEFFL